jgi:hypothetical protein
MHGVIETATGNLLRAGYVDFENDGGFNAVTEAYRTDVPEDAQIRSLQYRAFSRWTGSAWETVEDLAHIRAIKNAEIDKRTRVLIGQGFVYDGHLFSLSEQAQMNIVGLKTPVDLGWVTFPHKMSTMNDDDPEYELPDLSAYYSVYAQAVGTIKAHMDSGRALKIQVAACTTVAEVDAVEDTR